MEFTLTTTELQHLVIALIYAEVEWGKKRDEEWVKTAAKMKDLFAEINALTKEEHDYNAKFSVTF